ncbi:serine protease 27-like [Protopterus annectens]|uniref:serine protease 27-like n=1 Tax=Protopterus annectens TaxID=7888 RepID=UPI001CFAE105|nr:serine protease 27-like [Protopterus annectens]
MIYHKLLGIFAFILGIQDSHLQACGKPKYNTRIVGGTYATEGAWPWQVSIQKNEEHICGGCLISDSWVVTAAHCFNRFDAEYMFQVKIGSHQLLGTNVHEISRGVSAIMIHEDFTDSPYRNDMALLQLDESVNFTDYIRPVCLPNASLVFPDGKMCWVTGWGRIKYGESLPAPKTLQEVNVPIISQPVCDCLYHKDSNILLSEQIVSSDAICAGYVSGGKDACQGDSGGPLVCNVGDVWVLAGLVSWGDKCALPNRPGVYSRLSAYQDWLQTYVPGLDFIWINQTYTDIKVNSKTCSVEDTLDIPDIPVWGHGICLVCSTSALLFNMIFAIVLALS